MKKIIFLFLFSINVYAEKLPDFTMPVYKQNATFKLSEELKGKKILINFWATWCISCIKEMPQLEALKAQHEKDVIFVAVNAGEELRLIDKFFRKQKFSYIQLLDLDRKFSKSINVESLPVTIVLDKDMNVIYRDVTPPKTL